MKLKKNKKVFVAQPGFEPATFRFEVSHLNHYTTAAFWLRDLKFALMYLNFELFAAKMEKPL